MNFNAIIATLIIKGIITEIEGQALVEFLHDKPQSTVLKDCIAQVKEIITMPETPLTGGPEQRGEELRAREAAAAEVEATEEVSQPETPASDTSETTSTEKSSKK